MPDPDDNWWCEACKVMASDGHECEEGETDEAGISGNQPS